jgi:hypothetical protein
MPPDTAADERAPVRDVIRPRSRTVPQNADAVIDQLGLVLRRFRPNLP